MKSIVSRMCCSSFEKIVTSDSFMTSKINLRWFPEIANFFSIRLLTVEVRFPITKLHLEIRTIFGKLNFSEILTILPESQILTRKMAESSLLNTKNALFYCTGDHVGSETASTDVYKLMCRMHIPVYLFGGARDDIFVTHHYHDVSIFFLSSFFEET